MLRSGVVVAAWVVVGAASLGARAAEPSTIRVTAHASVAVKPDQAEIDVGVTTDKKTAAAAVAENERKMNQVIAALKKEIGADGEVKTSEINVSPRFEKSRNGVAQRILGYTVTNTVHVRDANVKAAGRLLDAALQSGANTVQRVAFTLKDPEAAQSAALRAASAKARARATAMAEGQGLRVGDVLSVSEGQVSTPFAEEGDVMMRARLYKAEAMPVEAGTIEVTASVTVVFALKTR
jgi:uncharacterized protein YggE